MPKFTNNSPQLDVTSRPVSILKTQLSIQKTQLSNRETQLSIQKTQLPVPNTTLHLRSSQNTTLHCPFGKHNFPSAKHNFPIAKHRLIPCITVFPTTHSSAPTKPFEWLQNRRPLYQSKLLGIQARPAAPTTQPKCLTGYLQSLSCWI